MAVNGSKTTISLPPPPPLRIAPQFQKSLLNPILIKDSDYDDIAEDSDDDDDGAGNLFEPQVILNTSAHDDQDVDMAEPEIELEEEEEEEPQYEEEFCDICSMELINHADEEPCEPHEGYVKTYKFCRVCDAREPTREHVARHFLPELLEVVDCFPNPLACTQCDYQAETSVTVALHIALVHSQIDEYLEDKGLVRHLLNLFLVQFLLNNI